MDSWLELENIMLSESSPVVKDKSYDPTSIWSLINKTNKQNITKATEIMNKLTVTREEMGGDDNWRKG